MNKSRSDFTLVKPFSIAVTAILISQNALAVVWPNNNNPGFFLFPDETLETRLEMLPKVGNVVQNGGHTPFSDTYWPDNDIGVASRYRDSRGNVTPQKIRSDVVLQADEKGTRPTLDQLKKMSVDEINALSLAEKFDIANGDYDYPFTHRVIASQKGNAHYAYGICHGWSAAASNYSEPQKSTFINKDGLLIPFGASDVKGLIAFYYAWEASWLNEKKDEHNNNLHNWDYQNQVSTHIVKNNPEMVYFDYRRMGERCSARPCEQTINPGALHLSLANVVGRYGRSFEVEANNAPDLWNYPIIGYASELKGGRSFKGPNGAVSKVEVKTDLYFTDETDPTHETTNGTLTLAQIAKKVDGFDRLGLTQAQAPGGVDSRHLVYSLFLDAGGNVVGGEWSGSSVLRGRDHRNQKIGFVWRASRVPFRAKYKILNDIYKPLETGTNVYTTTENL